MTCPYFQERRRHCRCLALHGDSAPTIYQRETFCFSESCVFCPSFVGRAEKGAPLSEDEYVARWSGAEEAPREP
jgi:hypothetical protein